MKSGGGRRPSLDAGLVGKRYPPAAFEVTAAAIESYARATNDLNERYLSGDASVASPVWPVVPAFGSFMAAARDPDLGADLRRLVHASEEHVLFEPIRPGDTLTVAAMLESVEVRDNGHAFTVCATETNQHGAVAAVVHGTMLVRGSGRRARRAPAARGTAAVEDVTFVDEDQAARYAAASGDHNPIHIDERMARLAGLRGVILHGMCTMAIAVKGAVNHLAGGDPARIGRVGASFSRPVAPSQELTTGFWLRESAQGARTYGFETRGGDGAAVLDDASIEVRE